MMERTVRKLMIAFWGLIGAALVVVAVFEFNVLSTGILSGDNSLEFLIIVDQDGVDVGVAAELSGKGINLGFYLLDIA